MPTLVNKSRDWVDLFGGAALEVEWGPTAKVIDDDTSWVSMVDNVRAVSIQRGRSNELDSFSAGSATVTLANGDRRFDPSHATGPYYGNLLPNKPIRIMGEWAGTVYPLFRGFVDGWPQSYTPPRDATVEVGATDAFKLLAALKLASSIVGAWPALIQDEGPKYWWEFEERLSPRMRVATVSLESSVGQADLIQYYNPYPPSEVIAIGQPGAVRNCIYWPYGGSGFKHLNAGYLATTDTTTYSHAFEFWYKTTSTSAQRSFFEALDFKEMRITTNGSLLYQSPPGTTRITSTDDGWNDGEWHHVILNCDAGLVATLWIDGANQGSVSHSQNIGPTFYFCVGGKQNQTYPYEGYLDELIFWEAPLTEARITNHYAVGSADSSGDYPGDRISDVLDLARWPTALRDLQTGTSPLGSPDYTNLNNALDACQTINKSEFGRFYVSNDGKVTFQQRDPADSRTTTSQATFGDGGGSELPYADLSYSWDDSNVYSEVTVENTYGDPITVSNAEAEEQYGVLPFRVTSDLPTEAGATTLATWILDKRDAPHLRIDSMTIKPRRAPTTLWPQVLGREIADRITVRRRPQSVGSVIEEEYIIEGVSHEITPDDWTTVFLLSPV